MDPDRPDRELTWRARRVQPVVILYVVLVFLAFMVPAWFVFHSPDAVKALLATAVGAVVSLVPSVVSRVEYRLTESGLEKRPHRAEKPKEFEPVFTWDELSHVVSTGAGFKFYKRLDEASALRRFVKLHLSAGYSGEFHVESKDRPQLSDLLEQRGIPTSRRISGGTPNHSV